MHLVEKVFGRRKYYYWVEKARRGRRVVTTQTIYIGDWKKLSALAAGQAVAALPESYTSQEVGASLALARVSQDLGIEQIIDEACPVRAGASPVGRPLLLVALHRLLAPRWENGLCNLKASYANRALAELLPVAGSCLDDRRLCEMLARIRPAQIEAIESAVVQRVIQREDIDREVLAFDCTNFDSYVAATTPSRLLKRGHGKSKRQLRNLGLALLVTEDGGIPLLSFTYPGNQNDVTAFKRFLRALEKRRGSLSLPLGATVAADGGNISKEILRRLEKPQSSKVDYVLRLPEGHAGRLDRVASAALPPLEGLKGVRAQRYECSVYSKTRCVVDVYSPRMHRRQLPGVLRDQRKARKDLVHLQRQLDLQRQGRRRAKPLTVPVLKRRVKEALRREHMRDLFVVDIVPAEQAPVLSFRESDEHWQRLETHVLGRTLLVTSRRDWSTEKVVRVSRVQSKNEWFFRDSKNPSGASMLPLRHRRDPTLRAKALAMVIGLLLAKVLLRRLKLAGVAEVRSVCRMLSELKAIQRARMRLPRDSAPALRALAARTWVPSERSELQDQMLRALKLQREPSIGTTLFKTKSGLGSGK